MSALINKVMLEGEVARSTWGVNGEEGAFFINIKQPRQIVGYNGGGLSFNAYANRPLAADLAKAVYNRPNCRIYIEGKLRTYYSKKDNQYRTTILIDKFSRLGPNE